MKLDLIEVTDNFIDAEIIKILYDLEESISSLENKLDYLINKEEIAYDILMCIKIKRGIVSTIDLFKYFKQTLEIENLNLKHEVIDWKERLNTYKENKKFLEETRKRKNEIYLSEVK